MDREERRRRPQTEMQRYQAERRADAIARRERFIALNEARYEERNAERRASRELARADAMAALEAAAKRADHSSMKLEMVDPERSGMWTGLAVGLGIAALVGVAGVVVYLLVRKRDNQVTGVMTPSGLAQLAQPMSMNGELSGSLQSIANALARKPNQYGDVVMKSYRLPSVTDKTRGAIRVAQATGVPAEVVLRTVGPAGQWAVYSYTPAELNMAWRFPGLPIGDTIIIPSGDWQIMRLQPRQVIYAKGSDARVSISVTTTEVAGAGSGW